MRVLDPTKAESRATATFRMAFRGNGRTHQNLSEIALLET
jgi:hypothetical protein